ncbi:MAG: hypothetical protein JSU64_01850 [candidate division WOR-3 bacterium]|nr:MAG: hypothetical protein JSU64_01850 [candidate division WOR-3 bacterium]
MNKRVFLIAIIFAMVAIGCSNGKEVKATDQKMIEKVAHIAALLEVNEAKALDMLTNEKMSVEKYKEIITAITLDPTATEKFVQLKRTYVDQYKK